MKISNLPLKIVFGLLILLSSYATQAQRKVGYMPYWAGDANAIQYDKLTHINYSFAIPQSNGSLYAIENPGKLQTIVSRAHAVGCKVLIAIGGWSYNGMELDATFETLASNSASRARFVNDAMYIVNTYNLDGVDMDWEYPNAGASANNFNALLSELSAKLRPAGKLLSAAVIGNDQWNNGINSGAFGSLDFLNIMAYDNDAEANHSTINYAKACVQSYMSKGCPASKINLGVPFYARPSWTAYNVILSQGGNANSDVFNGSYYNGIPTIKEKANYVKSAGLGGIMIWELSQDVGAGDSRSLLSAIHSIINGTVNPPPPVVQGPYGNTVTSLPGKLEAERYDVGGQGVAYNDVTSGNSGGAFRTDDVDVEACTDAGGGYNIGYTANGEWLEYTVNVTSAGLYKIEARVASQTGGSFTIDIPGTGTTAAFNVGNTGGWQSWQTVTLNNVNLTAGQKIIKLNISGEFNLNHITFSKGTTPPPTGPVIVYQHCNNDPGYSVGLNEGTYTTAQMNALGIANNDISTVTVQSGYQVTLYNNDNMDASGGSYTTTSNTSCLTSVGFNDMASSIRVSKVTTNPNNQAPTVTLTSPSNGASVNAPGSFTISANASDADGSVAKVDFYNGSALLFSDNSAPYSYNWNGVAAGTYTIKAIATDDKGANTTSGSVTVTVRTVTTGGCPGISQYAENGGYVAGSKTKNGNNQYECKPWPYSGWCNGAAWAYAPGTGAYWTDAWTLVGSCGTGREEAVAAVNESLLNNAPNPFSGSTTIELTTADAGDVSVKVYDKTGQLIRVISEGSLNAGTHQFVFDAAGLPADMYLIKCNTPNGVITRKMIKTE